MTTDTQTRLREIEEQVNRASSCAIAYIDELKAEASSLRAQLDAVTKERDADKARLDWLDGGHCVVCLSKPETERGYLFSADFEGQEWNEFHYVRAAIDAARNAERNNDQSANKTNSGRTDA